MKKRIMMEEVKKIELDMLKEFATYCEKHNLKYVLAYGTLLGAVRHKGFIPWDDDIDVLMPRDDYEIFIKTIQNHPIRQEYKILSHKTKTGIYPYLKLINCNTEVIEKYVKEKSGVWIDIFPVDKVGNDDTKNEQIYRKIERMRYLHKIAIARPLVGTNIKKKILRTLAYPITLMLNSHTIADKIDTIAQTFNCEEKNKAWVDYVWGSKLYYFPVDLFDYVLMEFEGEKFRIPKSYDVVLKLNYGNYMELPSEEERVGHAMEAYWKN